jgi:L-ascorbate metabolism protein UlaG (beta-lactamase superfamily)
VAILPLGDNFTMGVDDALLAAQFIECKRIIGCHFDTFGYIVINHDDAIKKFAVKNINLVLPAIGQEIEI